MDHMSSNLQPLTVCAREPAATTPSCGLNKSSAFCWELGLFTLGEYTFAQSLHINGRITAFTCIEIYALCVPKVI